MQTRTARHDSCIRLVPRNSGGADAPAVVPLRASLHHFVVPNLTLGPNKGVEEDREEPVLINPISRILFCYRTITFLYERIPKSCSVVVEAKRWNEVTGEQKPAREGESRTQNTTSTELKIRNVKVARIPPAFSIISRKGAAAAAGTEGGNPAQFPSQLQATKFP